MKKIISLLLISLIVQLCWSQSGEGYDPANPADPQLYYSLTLESAPKKGGRVESYVNTRMLTAGTKVFCYANPKQGYKFKQWMEGENIISKESSFSYTMPDRNVILVAYFDKDDNVDNPKDDNEYNPENPGDPNKQGYSHKVSLYASPSAAGTFNSSYFELYEGDSTKIFAFPRNGYRFDAWLKNGKVYSVKNPLSIVMGTTNQVYTAKFSYNPENPNDPGANVFNTATGALVVDRFKPGYLYSAISNAVGQNEYSAIQSILISGVLNSEDLGFSSRFSNCSSIDISRTSGYTEIPSWSFENCEALSSIILPSCIQEIGRNAFEGCANLSVVTCYALIPPTLNANAFGNQKSLVVKVPSSALALYKKAEGWKNFSILPLDEETSNIMVNLPIDASDGRYNNMYIELCNLSSGQILKNLISNGKSSFTFVGLLRDCTYNVCVKTSKGSILGEKKDLTLGDNNLTVSFSSLLQPQNIILKLYTPDGNEIEQSKFSVSWLDKFGNYIGQGESIIGLIEGETVEYNVTLAQDLAENYKAIEQGNYTVKSANNDIAITLSKYSKIGIRGVVKDLTTERPVPGAVIAVSQTLNGKYSKTFTSVTDANGNFALEAYEGKGVLAISASNYITQNIDVANFASELPEISLKPITGASVQITLNYKESSVKASEANVYEYYSDIDNISYTIYNKTKGKNINEFSVQYPSIVLLEHVDEGDELCITGHSKNGVFADVKASCIIDAYNRAVAHFDIIQYGAIKSVITSANNQSYIGMLFDSNGLFVSKNMYKDGVLTMNSIEDGEYTLLSMLNSKFFNTISNLEDMKVVGLVDGTDFVTSKVEIHSGLISELSYETIPVFNESKFYYTGNETSFIANKAFTTIGNYVTLRGNIDFKTDYASSVSGVYLIVDIPTSCKFVENSVLTGKGLASYTLDGNKLSIPLEGTDNNVRFCVIPTQGGDFNPTASIQFELNNENIVQPIGAAYFCADNLSLNAPEKTPNKIIAVSGTATADSEVKVYDNDVLVCQTRSTANGYWATNLPLVKPYSHSFHKIYGETTDMNGNILLTDTKTVEYDESYVVLSKVSMIYNGTTIVFDEINGNTSNNTYSYAPSVTDFTFVADFTSNDTAKIGDVVFKVLASDGTIRSIDAKYSESKKKWVAKANYGDSNKLPINATAKYSLLMPKIESKWQLDDEILALDTICGIIQKETNDKVSFTLVEDEDNYALYSYNFNDKSLKFSVEVLDYANSISRLKEKQFEYIQLENGFYFRDVNMTDDNIVITIIDTEEQMALELKLIDSSMSLQKVKGLWNGMGKFFGKRWRSGDLLGDIGNIYGGVLDVLGIKKYLSVPHFKMWNETFTQLLEKLDDQNEFTTNKILAKCPDGSFKLSIENMERFGKDKNRISDIASNYANDYYNYLDLYRKKLMNSMCYDLLTGALTKVAGEIVGAGKIMKNSKNSKYFKYLIPAKNKAQRNWIVNGLGIGFNAIVNGVTSIIDPITNPEFADFTSIENGMKEWVPKKYNDILYLYRNLNKNIISSYKNCKKKEETDDEKDRQFKIIFVCPVLKPSIDPSGYVYEGVPSNRLEGVTASIYYKETMEDMYGELHDKVVLWDASEYAQENPLFTDKDGMYAWDVPQGLWQVKFEKEGYETTYSEWLPVPPPQLDVNIGMVQNSQPEVKTVHAYNDGVEIDFSKYMLPSTLTTANILVSVNGKTIEGTTELLNVENEASGNSYASKVRFVPTECFSGDHIMLTVSNKVKSYANVALQETFCQEFPIEQKLETIEVDSVINMTTESEHDVSVHVLPASCAKGKKLNIKTNSPLIVSLSDELVFIDEEGKANITIKGELPGSATLEYSIDGFDIIGKTVVNVIDDRLQMTDNPMASIASGSEVSKGTSISLSCSTKNAVIYYTLDGSCPCENSAARKLYDGAPIIINEDTQIRAIAYSDDLYESEVVSFFYKVSGTSGIENIKVNKVDVYPTVTKNVVNVNIKDGNYYNIIVANVSGILITSLENVTGNNPINLAGLPSGMYVVAVHNNTNKYVVKVIKIE